LKEDEVEEVSEKIDLRPTEEIVAALKVSATNKVQTF
jgi:hypothetical protein